MSKRYRDYGPSLFMLAGSGLLAVVLLWQWLHYRHLKADLRSRLAAKVDVRLQAPPKEERPYALPGLEDYAATVERPLFMETRRPAEADAGEPAPAAAPKLPLTAKLMGVVFAPGQAPLGLFIDARGKYKRRHSGDADLLDGWKVVRIEADKAVMEQDGAQAELKLVKGKPKKPPVQPPPGAPGSPGFPGAPGFPVAPGGAPPAGQFPGQPTPFDPNNNPEIPRESVDSEPITPNDPVDEIPAVPEEIPNDQ